METYFYLALIMIVLSIASPKLSLLILLIYYKHYYLAFVIFVIYYIIGNHKKTQIKRLKK